MKEEHLKELGYEQFGRSRLDNPYILHHWQKRFDDEIGKKYFITVNVWEPFSIHGQTADAYTYEYEVQFTDKVTGNPVNLNFFAGWDVEDVENRVEEMFRTGLWRHYETWEEA